MFKFLYFWITIIFFFILYICSFIILFPFGLLIIYPILMIYRKINHVEYKYLDNIVFKNSNRIARLFLSSWTNSIEPMPLYGKAKYLWLNKPQWLRYLKWHIRNPVSDFNKFYLGFYNKRDRVSVVWNISNKIYELQLKKVEGYKILFPRLDIYLFGFWFCFGYKKRGSLSLSLKRRNNRPFIKIVNYNNFIYAN